MKQNTKRVINTAFLLMLSGCSTMNSNFDCPQKDGVMCKSVSDVNHMVDSGQLGRSSFSQKQKASDTSFGNNTFVFKKEGNSPTRAAECVSRIWISPYEDKDGNYHDETMLYKVTSPSYWVKPTVKS